MNDHEMTFDDEEIREMYKANVKAAAPDMRRLWGRIEAAVDASEQETAGRQIKPSGRKKGMMRFAAAAAAFVLVAGAGAVWFRLHSSEDGSQAPMNNGGTTSSVMSETAEKPEQSGLTEETDKENIIQNNTDHLGTNAGEETDNDAEHMNNHTNSFGTDPFVSGSSESIVLVRVYSEFGADTAEGWFMDSKGDVYSFEGVPVKGEGSIYARLERLTEGSEPVSSEGEETAQRIRALTDNLSDKEKPSASDGTGKDRCYAVGNRAVAVNARDDEAAAELVDIAENIETELRDKDKDK